MVAEDLFNWMSVYFCRQFLLSIRRLLYVFFCFLSHFRWSIYVLFKWMKTLLSIRRLLFIFCLLSHFDFFNVFLCWIATEKKEVKKPFLGARAWAPRPVYRAPKRPGYATGGMHAYMHGTSISSNTSCFISFWLWNKLFKC